MSNTTNTATTTASMEQQQLQKWCKSIPKVELHAHLNGSISDSTIKILLERVKDTELKNKLTQQLEKCGQHSTMDE